jgi:hypothetical protein
MITDHASNRRGNPDMHQPLYNLGPYNLGTARQLAELVDQHIQKLMEACNILPTVDREGFSECPYAEELYAKKEERAKELRNLQQLLFEYRAAAEKEIERLRHNRMTVAHDASQLDSADAKGHYSKAEDDLETQYNDHDAMRKRLVQKINASKKALSDSNDRVWTGGTPRQRSQYPAPAATTGGDASGVGDARLDQKELDDLSSLDESRRLGM